MNLKRQCVQSSCVPQDMGGRNGSPAFVLRSGRHPQEVWILAHENNKHSVGKSSIVAGEGAWQQPCHPLSWQQNTAVYKMQASRATPLRCRCNHRPHSVLSTCVIFVLSYIPGCLRLRNVCVASGLPAGHTWHLRGVCIVPCTDTKEPGVTWPHQECWVLGKTKSQLLALQP